MLDLSFDFCPGGANHVPTGIGARLSVRPVVAGGSVPAELSRGSSNPLLFRLPKWLIDVM